MKAKIFFFVIAANFFFSIYAQDITGTLSSAGNGKFTIADDAGFIHLQIQSSDGVLNVGTGLRIPNTTDDGIGTPEGVIFQGSAPFIHSFVMAGAIGNNTFVGKNAGSFSAGGSGIQGSFNTGMGSGSLSNLTTGNSNAAFGDGALNHNTTGEGNSAFGSISLELNIAGGYNSAFGNAALENNTSDNNSAFGFVSLQNNTTGTFNSAYGSYSMRLNSTGASNSAFGFEALFSNTEGFNNTAVGYQALRNNTGNYNTAVGYNAGTTVTSGANLTMIGIDANPSSPTAVDEVTLGNQFVQTLRCNTTTITSLSDARDKKNIKDLSLGLDFLMKIKPRQFNWDRREWYSDGKSDGTKMQEAPTAGFIAQELDKVQTEEEAEWLKLVLKENPDRIEASAGNLFPIVVKAVQDLKNEKDLQIAQLKSENEKLRTELESMKELQTRLAKLEQVIINSDLKFTSNITE